MEKRLLEFISKFTAESPFVDINKITEMSGVEEDLYLYGDEAAEFLEDYGNLFNVDIREFNFPLYFTKETGFQFFYRKFPVFSKKRKELRVKDLIEGIRLGYLK